MDANWKERANGWLGFYTLLEAQEQLDVEDFDNMDQISTLQNLRESFFERFESEYEACTGGNREMGVVTESGDVKHKKVTDRSLEAAVSEHVGNHFSDAFESFRIS